MVLIQANLKVPDEKHIFFLPFTLTQQNTLLLSVGLKKFTNHLFVLKSKLLEINFTSTFRLTFIQLCYFLYEEKILNEF